MSESLVSDAAGASSTMPVTVPAAVALIDPNPEKLVSLVTSDGQTFKINRAVACTSITVKNMLEDIADTEAAVPLPNVTAKIMQKVVDFCEYHHANPAAESKFVKGGKVDGFGEWDTKFTDTLKADVWALFETILAANYLDVKPLLDIACRTVAGMIKGKTPEQICTTFIIKPDATEAELEEVRKANPWLDEL